MLSVLGHFARDERGATAIEYGLIGALVSIAAVVAMTTVGQSLNDFFFVGVSQSLQNAIAS